MLRSKYKSTNSIKEEPMKKVNAKINIPFLRNAVEKNKSRNGKCICILDDELPSPVSFLAMIALNIEMHIRGSMKLDLLFYPRI